jgi:hypothetical protein
MRVADKRSDKEGPQYEMEWRQKGDNIVLDVVDDEHALLGP